MKCHSCFFGKGNHLNLQLCCLKFYKMNFIKMGLFVNVFLVVFFVFTLKKVF
jgi:hypothetical protein